MHARCMQVCVCVAVYLVSMRGIMPSFRLHNITKTRTCVHECVCAYAYTFVHLKLRTPIYSHVSHI